MNLKKIKKTFVFQQDYSDCGVACLQSLVKYYGGNISLEKLREISGTTKQGTTLLGLFQGANQIGFRAQGNEADIEAIIDHGKPLILHVLLNKQLQHYVVCYGFEKDKFIIGDPGKGIRVLFKKRTGRDMEFKKMPDLRTECIFSKNQKHQT